MSRTGKTIVTKVVTKEKARVLALEKKGGICLTCPHRCGEAEVVLCQKGLLKNSPDAAKVRVPCSLFAGKMVRPVQGKVCDRRVRAEALAVREIHVTDYIEPRS